MVLISMIVFCISILYINSKKRYNNIMGYKDFFNDYIPLIRHCVYRIGYTTFDIKKAGIYKGRKVWWLFHVEGYDDLSNEQCVIFAKIAIDQLELLHPGHIWNMKIIKDNKKEIEGVRVYHEEW